MEQRLLDASPLFYVNGKKAKVDASHCGLSLNEYIRQHTPFKGTKLACGEGGCGACAVKVEQYDTKSGKTHSSSINSCLCPVGSLDGQHIITVEGLGNSKAGFSRVQESFARNHASQCGFCTPGFVVACHATLAKAEEAGLKPTPEAMMQGLDGNLCRCTGYTTILDACKDLTGDMEDLCSAQPPCATAFPQELVDHAKRKAADREEGGVQTSVNGVTTWFSPKSLPEVFELLEKYEGAHILAGNTAAGVYHEWPTHPTIINIKGVEELSRVSRSQEGLEFGAAVPFATIIDQLREGGKDAPEAYLNMAAHIERIAGSHVRWAATPGGNLALLVDPQHYLESDFATVLAGAGGRVQVTTRTGSRWLPMEEFLRPDVAASLGKSHLITGIAFPPVSPGFSFWSHKVAQRYYNSHALVNLAMSSVSSPDGAVRDVKIHVGCPTLFREPGGCAAKVAWQLRRAERAEGTIEGKILTAELVAAALEGLQEDICPGNNTDATAEWYRQTAEGLLFQGLCRLLPESLSTLGPKLGQLLSAEPLPPPSVPAGRQKYQHPPKAQLPVGLPIEKDRIHLQASGEAQYTSDIGVGGNQLYAAVVASAEALATIDKIDTSEAMQVTGAVAFVGADDVAGENLVYCGGADAQLFASKKAEYVGQPLGLIVAEDPQAARKAASLVRVKYSDPKENGTPILTIKDAVARESYFEIPDGSGGKVERGDVATAFANAKHVIKNARYTLPSQQHFYMETQAAVVEPQEGGTFLVHSSTQTLDGVQSAVARVLGTPANNIVAVCRRAGGGFGGKVTRSMPVAAAAAVAASKTGRTVHYHQNRNEDFRINGGRSETEIEFDVGFDDSGRISALSVRGWFLGGADIDLAWNDMMILQTGADQVYDIKNIALDLRVVRTNLPPRTIMRGPGFMDAAMVIEQVLEQVCSYLDADPAATRRLNFLKAPSEAVEDGEQSQAQAAPAPSDVDTQAPAPGHSGALGGLGALGRRFAGICARALPTTMKQRIAAEAKHDMMRTTLSRPFKAECWTLPRIWEGLLQMSDYHARRDAVADFNAHHTWRKRGISINPCRFDSNPQPINAHVNIYYDGSILLTHGGLEVGQGLSTKVKQMAVYELSKLLPEGLRPLPLDLVRINDTRSDIVPNAGPTWSSTGSESTCMAVQHACRQLVDNLTSAAKDVEGNTAEAFWKAAIAKVHTEVGYVPATAQLSAMGFFDGSETGGKEPMNYSAFGAAVSEVELDVLTGEKLVLRSDIHFDCGQSLNPAVDMGQVEGAFIQGLGYLTSEEVVVDEGSGRLITDGTWTYKIPAASCIPQQMNVEFLKDSPNPKGVLGSKASGEPSLLLTTSILYALRNAVVAARQTLLAEPSPHHPKQSSTTATSTPESHTSKADGGPSPTINDSASKDEMPTADKAGHDFFVLAAPATTVKLKQACGEFSVAELLKDALRSGGDSQRSSSESWVKVDAAVSV